MSVPAGVVRGLPFGVAFIGTAFSEARLLQLAYGFEQACPRRLLSPLRFPVGSAALYGPPSFFACRMLAMYPVGYAYRYGPRRSPRALPSAVTRALRPGHQGDRAAGVPQQPGPGPGPQAVTG